MHKAHRIASDRYLQGQGIYWTQGLLQSPVKGLMLISVFQYGTNMVLKSWTKAENCTSGRNRRWCV